MGHIRLGILPKHRKWKSVVNLIADTEISTSRIADEALDAANEALCSDAARSSVAYCIWLLSRLAIASREDDFARVIISLGYPVQEGISASEFLATTAHTASLQLSKLHPRNSLNTIAGLALREVLTTIVRTQSETLFGAGINDVQQGFKSFSSSSRFSLLTRSYFSVFLERVLRFILDKEIANHIGGGKRFVTANDLDEFEEAIEVFALQTARIIEKFGGGWYSKKQWESGTITRDDANRFVHVALRKLSSDLDIGGAS